MHGGARDALHVVLHTSNVPDAVATDDVLAGMREELARADSLAPGTGYPRCEVEVLRMDEASEGIAAVPDFSGAPLPQSRATRVGLVARAWLVRSAGGTRERDTGDVRVFDTVNVATDARTSMLRSTDALRAAARKLGKRLARRILGMATPTDD